ncbi:MFS transporter [Bacillus changyiensis]|uniref:MFS transporter n=1 Tax=Bacillus changyiensis TaxID=3004103 RepID=UPI0022E74D62|nr:MFS transporter [Bacillus changyiensis]MDA1476795.1 MFS transporter [Bacillus changyiensis]
MVTVSDQKNLLYYFLMVFFFLTSISVGIGIYELIPLYRILGETYHLSENKTIYLGSAFSLGYAIGFLLFGWLSKFFEKKKLLLFGLFMLALCTAFAGFSFNYFYMLCARIFQGVSAGSFAPLSFAIILKIFPENKRAAANATVTTGFVMASIIGQLFSSFITSLYNWSAVFWIQAGLYLTTLLFLSLLVPTSKDELDMKQANQSNYFVELLKLLINPALLPCYLITLSLLFSFVSFYTVMSQFFLDRFSFTETNIIWLRSIGIIGMIAAIWFSSPRIIHKWGPLKLLKTGLAISSAGALLMAFSPTVIFAGVMSTLFVFGITLILPMMVSLVGTQAGQQGGTAVTLYTIVLFIGATLGPILVNFVMKQTHCYWLPFIIISLLLCISFTLTFSIKMKGERQA